LRPFAGMHAQLGALFPIAALCSAAILYTPRPYIYPYPLSGVKRARVGAAIIPCMTLLEITYELQSPLSLEQMNRLGEFANTYGLRRFQIDEQQNRLTFEYDASRLRETQVAHVLGQAGIAVTRKLN